MAGVRIRRFTGSVSRALRDLGLGQESLYRALFGFNVGVELGQLTVALMVVVLLSLLRGRERWEVFAGGQAPRRSACWRLLGPLASLFRLR